MVDEDDAVSMHDSDILQKVLCLKHLLHRVFCKVFKLNILS